MRIAEQNHKEGPTPGAIPHQGGRSEHGPNPWRSSRRDEVEQATSVLQIEWSLAYELIRVWGETNEREALPVICLRYSSV